MSPADFAAQVQARVLQTIICEASATYWRRRAQQYRWALPRPEDFPGRDTTEEERQARRRRLEALARACEDKAEVMAAAVREAPDADVWAALLGEEGTA